MDSSITPVFSLPGGSYRGYQSVGISSPQADATIYYTTDGSDPASSDTRVLYTQALFITRDTTVKAVALKPIYIPKFSAGQVALREMMVAGGKLYLRVDAAAVTNKVCAFVRDLNSGSDWQVLEKVGFAPGGASMSYFAVPSPTGPPYFLYSPTTAPDDFRLLKFYPR